MQTNSFVIRKITAFLLWLNYYFEYSLIYKGLETVKNSAKRSRILNDFLSTEYRDYWQGSLIMRFISFIAGGIISLAGQAFRLIVRLNETGINKKIFIFCVEKLKEPNGFWTKSFATCIPVRAMHSFFGDEKANLKENALTVFSFLNLKTIYMLFICVTLMIPSTMWNNRYLMLSAVFFAGAYAVNRFLSGAGKEKPSFAHISPALVLFVFFCVLSIFTGFGGQDSLRVFIIFFACVVHSVLVALIFKEKEDFRLLFMLLATALTVAAIFGFYQFYAGIEIREELVDLGASPGLSRLYSTMGNPNNDAQVWAMLLPFLIAVCITVKNDTKRAILIGMVLVILAAFALTYSRGGYVAFAAGMGIFVLMTAPRLVPVALLALVLALPFVPSGIIERLFTLGSDTSSKYRFLIWGGVTRMLEDYWVRGIGMGPAAFIRIYRGYAHPLAERAMHSHNTFFDLIVHSGIGAFSAFIAYLFRLFKRGISAHFASADTEQRIYISAGIAAIMVFVAFGVGEYVWFYPRVMFVFWVVAGLVLAMAAEKENVSKLSCKKEIPE